MAKYITKQYDVLDLICYKYYGDTKNNIVEWVLSQNPGLERQGILLEPGLTIELPDRPKEQTDVPVVTIWKLF